MKTKINAKWLLENTCCEDEQELKLTNKTRDVKKICNWLFDRDRAEDACWIILKCMDLKTFKKYVLYGAKKLLPIYEKEFPNDKYPRDCIKAIEKYNQNPTEENRKKVIKTADAAYTAYIATYAAAYAAYAAYAAAYAAAYDADVADYTFYDVAKKTKKQIMNYGLRLLYKDKK
jgi:hypothetical protein